MPFTLFGGLTGGCGIGNQATLRGIYYRGKATTDAASGEARKRIVSTSIEKYDIDAVSSIFHDSQDIINIHCFVFQMLRYCYRLYGIYWDHIVLAVVLNGMSRVIKNSNRVLAQFISKFLNRFLQFFMVGI